jgi:hypothetical protein
MKIRRLYERKTPEEFKRMGVALADAKGPLKVLETY